MVAAVSQLCVWQAKGVHSWTVSYSTRAVKVEQISPLFHLFFTYISTSFSSQKSIPSLPTWHAK